MGFQQPEFRALRITQDGKVIPDPTSLDPSREVENAPLRASLVDFDQSILNQIRLLNIRITSA